MVLVFTLAGTSTWANGAPQYPKTVHALQQRYLDEVVAHNKYGTYARVAAEDGYPNIAHLFRALAWSEAVHARNFKALLGELGGDIPPVPMDFQVVTTREHLKRATTVEADEIDHEYPAILSRIRSEHHEAAIESITWAWQAERQHRALIVKIRKAATYFFGLLVRRIEDERSSYAVCQICGSTLTAVPARTCPICGHPASHYKPVPGFPPTPRRKPGVSEGGDDTW